jgi:outer membrane protein assembly factor BamB
VTTLAPNITAPPTVGADGDIYVATTNGKVASVRADGSVAWEGSLTGAAINSAPMIDPCNQTLYVGSSDGFLIAVITDAAGLDTGPWPHFRHDYQGTGNASLTGRVDCANHL